MHAQTRVRIGSRRLAGSTRSSGYSAISMPTVSTGSAKRRDNVSRDAQGACADVSRICSSAVRTRSSAGRSMRDHEKNLSTLQFFSECKKKKMSRFANDFLEEHRKP